MAKRLIEHAPAAVVAVAVIAVSLADGGYGTVARGVLAISVWWAIILGLGLGFLPFRRIPREAYVSGGLLTALGVLAGLSIAWSASPERSFVEFDRVMLYVGLFIIAALTSTRANVGRWAEGLAIGIAVVGVLALATRLFPGLVPGSGEVTSIANARARLGFPLGYWNALGALLALGLPLLLRSAAVARSGSGRGLAAGVIPVLGCAIYLTSSRGAIAAALIAVAVLVVLARPRPAVVWAALCAGAGSAVAVALLRAWGALLRPFDDPALTAAHGRTFAAVLLVVCLATGAVYVAGRAVARARRDSLPTLRLGRGGRVALGGAATLALAALVIAASPGELVEGFRQQPGAAGGEQGASRELLSASGSGRYQFWSAAIDQFEAHPVLGGGAGAYELWWAANPRFPYFVRNAHSLWLETLGELGMVGLALLLGAFAYGLISAARRVRGRVGAERLTVAALSGALLAWAFAAAIDWMWEMTVVTAVAVVSLALLTGSATARESGLTPESAPARVRRGSRSFTLGVAVIAAAWLVICAQAAPLLSQLRMDESRAAAARGNFGEAIQAGRSALTLQPWAGTPYRQLALVEEERGRLGAARSYIRDAIEREPGNFELWEIAARIEADAGLSGEARRSLERSRQLNPRLSAAATVTR